MDLTCRLCGYPWESKIEKPKQCPRCKRYDYADKEKEAKE